MMFLRSFWLVAPLKSTIWDAIGGLLLMALIIGASNRGLAEVRQDALINKLHRPLSLAVQSPPDGFFRRLNAVGGDNPLIFPIGNNESAFNADIWAFFLKSEHDIPHLPQVVQDIFSGLPPAEKRPVSHYIEFTLTDGAPKAVIFYFSDNTPRNKANDHSCDPVVRLYSAVLGTSDGKVLDEIFSRCLSDE